MRPSARGRAIAARIGGVGSMPRTAATTPPVQSPAAIVHPPLEGEGNPPPAPVLADKHDRALEGMAQSPNRGCGPGPAVTTCRVPALPGRNTAGWRGSGAPRAGPGGANPARGRGAAATGGRRGGSGTRALWPASDGRSAANNVGLTGDVKGSTALQRIQYGRNVANFDVKAHGERPVPIVDAQISQRDRIRCVQGGRKTKKHRSKKNDFAFYFLI